MLMYKVSVSSIIFHILLKFGLKDIVMTSLRHLCLSVAIRNSQE